MKFSFCIVGLLALALSIGCRRNRPQDMSEESDLEIVVTGGAGIDMDIDAYDSIRIDHRLQAVRPEVARIAKKICDEYCGSPFGTEFPFSSDGEHYVGRIEEHYHPPGGPKKPWGYHHGVTVIRVEYASNL